MSQQFNPSSFGRSGIRRRGAAQGNRNSGRQTTEDQYASGVWYRADAPEESRGNQDEAEANPSNAPEANLADPYQIMMPEIEAPLAELNDWTADSIGSEISSQPAPTQAAPTQADATAPVSNPAPTASPEEFVELPNEWSNLFFTSVEVSARLPNAPSIAPQQDASEAKTVRADEQPEYPAQGPAFSESFAQSGEVKRPVYQGGIDANLDLELLENAKTDLLSDSQIKAISHANQDVPPSSIASSAIEEAAPVDAILANEIPDVFGDVQDLSGGVPISHNQVESPGSSQQVQPTTNQQPVVAQPGDSTPDKIDTALQSRQQKYRLDQSVASGIPKSKLPQTVFKVLSQLSVADPIAEPVDPVAQPVDAAQDSSFERPESQPQIEQTNKVEVADVIEPVATDVVAANAQAEAVGETMEEQILKSLEQASEPVAETRVAEAALADLLPIEAAETVVAPPIDFERSQDEAEALGVINAPAVGSEAALLPAWEVDFFRWPDITNRLLREEYESFDTVLQSLRIGTSVQGHVVFVTGVDREEGRSTIAICLARRAAGLGLSTLLIDGDLRNPSLDQQAGLEFTNGWLHQGPRQDLVEEALVRCMLSDLKLMPQGVVPANDSEGEDVRYQRLWGMLNVAQPHYDVLIVDAGVVSSFVPFASQGQPQIHNALLVQGHGIDSRDRLSMAYHSLLSIGVESVAVAETFGHRMAG